MWPTNACWWSARQPGLTAKWLAARLYRFASGHPEIEVRISSSLANANFTTDGVDVAVRHLAVRPGNDPGLADRAAGGIVVGAGVQSAAVRTAWLAAHGGGARPHAAHPR